MTNWITGNVTWYDLCNESHGGACGGCRNWDYHVAWPYLPSTGCYDSCGPNNPHGCQDWIYIEDACTSNADYGQVEDCCPCAPQEGCNSGYICNGYYYYSPQWSTPLADLTQAYFLALHYSLADGRIPVWILQ